MHLAPEDGQWWESSTNELLSRLCVLDGTRGHLRPQRTYWVDIHTVTTDEVPLDRMDFVAGMLVVAPRDSRLAAAVATKVPGHDDGPQEAALPLKRVSGKGTDDMFVWDRAGPTQFLRGGRSNTYVRLAQASPGSSVTVVLYGGFDESARDDTLPLITTLQEDLVPEPRPGVFVLDLVPEAAAPRYSALAFVRWRADATSRDTRLRVRNFGFQVDEWTTLAVRLGAFGTWDPAAGVCTLGTGTPTPVRHFSVAGRINVQAIKGPCRKRKRVSAVQVE
jgi:hypothetical protein